MSNDKLVFGLLDKTKVSTIFISVKDQSNHACKKIQGHYIVFHLPRMNNRKKNSILSIFTLHSTNPWLLKGFISNIIAREYACIWKYQHTQRLCQVSHKFLEWQGKWLKKSDEKKRSKINYFGIVSEKQSVYLSFWFLGSAAIWARIIRFLHLSEVKSITWGCILSVVIDIVLLPVLKNEKHCNECFSRGILAKREFRFRFLKHSAVPIILEFRSG